MDPTIVPKDQTITIPTYYLHRQEGEEKPLLILAHGFSDSGSSFYRRVAPAIGNNFEVLAPNGLFPQPIQQKGEWKEAYAWFFADLEKNKIYIHPDVSAKAIARIVNDLGLEDRPKILLGFSQGGYFLPYLAKELKRIERMIMIGSGFRPSDFEKYQIRMPVSALHGDKDDVISPERSRGEFHALGEWNKGGRFHVISGMTHSIDDNGRAKLKEILAE